MSKELGTVLYNLRVKTTKYRHHEIAERLGVERSTYTNYELGKTEPSLKQIKQLAEIFGVGYDVLVDPRPTEEEMADFETHKRSRKDK